jgi:hypothetical protein
MSRAPNKVGTSVTLTQVSLFNTTSLHGSIPTTHQHHYINVHALPTTVSKNIKV